MSQVITAPSTDGAIYPALFLAGGITDCKNWQADVIKELQNEDITIYNPRQEHFDITNPDAALNQITWEFVRLERMDIFSMYFCESTSDQPICMYELGRNIARMQVRFPYDWHNRIVISVEKGYKRAKDVIIQTGLCCGPIIYVNTDATPGTHAYYIKKAIHRVKLLY